MNRRYKDRMVRYWARQKEKAKYCLKNFNGHDWFDMWHYHTDWRAKGDKSEFDRELSVELSIQLLVDFEEFAMNHQVPCQCWLFIHDRCTENAIYLHTENRNGTPFPYDFGEFEWIKSKSVWFGKFINESKHKVGMSKSDLGTIYAIVKIA